MGDNIRSRLNDVGNTVKDAGMQLVDTFSNIMKKNPEEQLVEIIILIMIGLVVVIFVFWAYSLTTLEYKDCENLEKIYGGKRVYVKPIAELTSQGYQSNNIIFNPKDGNGRVFSYYVKTAYNCCTPGNFNNSFVSICALRNAISLGARCLDFEIYSLDLEPVISTTTQNDDLTSSFYIKETFNSLKLTDALYYIKYFALESSNKGDGATNYTDPLFLHFRIMTQQLETINKIAKYLVDILGDHLLGSTYGQNNYGSSMANKSLIGFCGKCIIMINNNNVNSADIQNSNLWPLTNIFTGGDDPNHKILRYSNIRSMSRENGDDLTSFNKYGITLILPDSNSEATNYDPRKCHSYGCQFIAMNFQTFDANLETYFKFFDDVGYSYVLKACDKRWIPVHYMISESDLLKGAGCSNTVSTNDLTVSGNQG